MRARARAERIKALLRLAHLPHPVGVQSAAGPAVRWRATRGVASRGRRGSDGVAGGAVQARARGVDARELAGGGGAGGLVARRPALRRVLGAEAGVAPC